MRVYGVCLKGEKILTTRDLQGSAACNELPFVEERDEECIDVWGDFISEKFKIKLLALGKRMHSQDHMGSSFAWRLLYCDQNASIEVTQACETGMWVERADIEKQQQFKDTVLQSLCKILKSDPGNIYSPVTTAQGIPTFAHAATGELLHGHAGPYEEALNLYINPLGLNESEGNKVVFDIGMGCGTLAMACRDVWLRNPRLKSLHVVSFDLEKAGLAALLNDNARFSYVQPHLSFLEAAVVGDYYEEKLPDWREFRWSFQGGDFRNTITNVGTHFPKADFVFYDFFSPRSHPELWGMEVMKSLFNACSQDVLLGTYSCATAVRATLAAAGFFVGLGIPSGKKAKTTMAAKRLEMLKEPLPASWLTTFLRSQLPYLPTENAHNQQEILGALKQHPQFRQGQF
jgi:tRNA U34 5-methylaminomethyl-2-thiouridine-forming methyltransferase MnmC